MKYPFEFLRAVNAFYSKDKHFFPFPTSFTLIALWLQIFFRAFLFVYKFCCFWFAIISYTFVARLLSYIRLITKICKCFDTVSGFCYNIYQHIRRTYVSISYLVFQQFIHVSLDIFPLHHLCYSNCFFNRFYQWWKTYIVIMTSSKRRRRRKKQQHNNNAWTWEL